MFGIPRTPARSLIGFDPPRASGRGNGRLLQGVRYYDPAPLPGGIGPIPIPPGRPDDYILILQLGDPGSAVVPENPDATDAITVLDTSRTDNGSSAYWTYRLSGGRRRDLTPSSLRSYYRAAAFSISGEYRSFARVVGSGQKDIGGTAFANRIDQNEALRALVLVTHDYNKPSGPPISYGADLSFRDDVPSFFERSSSGLKIATRDQRIPMSQTPESIISVTTRSNPATIIAILFR